MSEAIDKSCARELAGPRARTGRAGALDLTGAVGLLATALGRARELPGRIADAAELRERLQAHRSRVMIRIARAECEAATARQLGRDFMAHRARAEARALHDEAADVDAMLDEVGRVLKRLRREARSLAHRLSLCSAFAEGLPDGPDRARLAALVARARAELEAPAPARRVPGVELPTAVSEA